MNKCPSAYDSYNIFQSICNFQGNEEKHQRQHRKMTGDVTSTFTKCPLFPVKSNLYSCRWEGGGGIRFSYFYFFFVTEKKMLLFFNN